jgi:hypothetical protein
MGNANENGGSVRSGFDFFRPPNSVSFESSALFKVRSRKRTTSSVVFQRHRGVCSACFIEIIFLSEIISLMIPFAL